MYHIPTYTMHRLPVHQLIDVERLRFHLAVHALRLPALPDRRSREGGGRGPFVDGRSIKDERARHLHAQGKGLSRHFTPHSPSHQASCCSTFDIYLYPLVAVFLAGFELDGLVRTG